MPRPEPAALRGGVFIAVAVPRPDAALTLPATPVAPAPLPAFTVSPIPPPAGGTASQGRTEIQNQMVKIDSAVETSTVEAATRFAEL